MPRKGENIYKRKDGRWEGRYIKARSKTGKAVYGYVYAPTYKEAKRKRSQAIINIEANQTTICKVPETTMPTCFIRKLANDWMNSIQSQIKKYNLGPIDAIAKTMVRVRGSYALELMFKDYPGEIWVLLPSSSCP